MAYKITIDENGLTIATYVTSDAEKMVRMMANMICDNLTLTSRPIVSVDSFRGEKPEKTQKSVKKAGKKGSGRGYGVRHCKNCGKVGHRADGCPEGSNSAKNDEMDEDEAVSEGAMTRMEFSRAKELRKEGQTSKTIADDLDVALEEVNYAFSAITYDGYLKLRS